MSQIPKHIKIKRAQKRVLVKRGHFIRSYTETKSYKPLCKKLQSNNNSLAKALSKEKQESQLLFSQNVALIAEVQDLGLACSKRDAVISNILKNAKEMLKMLVTMTGYLTNTISSCQEFAESSAANMRMSCNSAGRKESYRRLSAKSPTKGVVKPMVSGHTITNPTINLSRLNIQRINNPSNLSIIPEVATPPRNQELNNSRSPNTVSLRQRKVENGRACRMPERLTASQRESDESERRLSERRSGRHSGKISGKLSRSRLSRNDTSRQSIEDLEHIGSPRVKLNDVSKLLQNSQSINIRMLTGNQKRQEMSNDENNDENNDERPEGPRTENVIPETPPSDGYNNDADKTIENKSSQSSSEMDITDPVEKEDHNESTNRSSNWEDPLEGPSWLFNNSQNVPSFVSKDKKTDNADASNNDVANETLKTTDENRALQNGESLPKAALQSFSNRRPKNSNSYRSSKQVNKENECSLLEQNDNDDTFCNTSATESPPQLNEEQYKVEQVAPTMNVQNFITHRRGYFECDDDDDFTLMYSRHPRVMHFDINDLKLPVLEQSVLKPVVPVEPEPEITTALRKISQICPMPSVSRNTLDETAFNQSTVKLPLLLNNDYEDKELTPLKKKAEPLPRKKKGRKQPARKSDDYIVDTPPNNKRNSQKRSKDKSVKDPSSVKVVLQKLNESDVKSRTPSPDQTVSRDSNFSFSPVSSRADNSSDSESNASTNGIYTASRPRRKRAPTSFQEPNLRKKLRRNV